MMQYVTGAIGSFGASLFFGMLFHAPKRCLICASLIGAIPYVIDLLVAQFTGSPVYAAFAASLLIAFFSELAARRLHAPATIFASIGVIPLVPGGGLYQTMFHMVQNDYSEAAVTGVETLLIAGCIALAIAVVATFSHSVHPEHTDKSTEAHPSFVENKESIDPPQKRQ